MEKISLYIHGLRCYQMYRTLRKLVFLFLSNLMGFDRVVKVFLSILNTKWNSIWFRKSKENLSPRSYPIQFERKRNTSFLSAHRKKKTPVTKINLPVVAILVNWYIIIGICRRITTAILFQIPVGIRQFIETAMNRLNEFVFWLRFF